MCQVNTEIMLNGSINLILFQPNVPKGAPQKEKSNVRVFDEGLVIRIEFPIVRPSTIQISAEVALQYELPDIV